MSLVALSGMGDDKPGSCSLDEQGALLRAHRAADRNEGQVRPVLTGMFSMIDAFIDQPWRRSERSHRAIKTALRR